MCRSWSSCSCYSRALLSSLRFRGVQQFPQDHTAAEWQRQDWNQDFYYTGPGIGMGRWGGRELPQAQPRIHSKSWPNSPQPGEQQAQVQRPCSWVLGILAHCILSRYYCYHPSFTWAQRGDVSCPRSRSYSGAKSRFKSRPSDFRDLVPMGRPRGRTSPPAFQALKEERRGASWQQGQRGVSVATTGRSKLTFLQSMMSFSLRKRKMPFP